MAVVRTLAMLQVEDKGQTLLGIVFRTDILFLEWTIRARALARVVDPPHEVIVVCFLANARQVRGESPTLHLIAFTDGVAAQASAHFEQFLTVAGVSRIALHR